MAGAHGIHALDAASPGDQDAESTVTILLASVRMRDKKSGAEGPCEKRFSRLQPPSHP